MIKSKSTGREKQCVKQINYRNVDLKKNSKIKKIRHYEKNDKDCNVMYLNYDFLKIWKKIKYKNNLDIHFEIAVYVCKLYILLFNIFLRCILIFFSYFDWNLSLHRNNNKIGIRYFRLIINID